VVGHFRIQVAANVKVETRKQGQRKHKTLQEHGTFKEYPLSIVPACTKTPFRYKLAWNGYVYSICNAALGNDQLLII